jgi:hypothetical protein
MIATTINAKTTISLAPGVTLDRDRLKDALSGAEYPVAGLGAEVLQRMVDGEPVGEITSAVAEKYDVSDETVAGDIETFIGQLDSQGLISTRQSYLVSIRAFVSAIAAAAPSPLDLLMLDTSTLAQPTRRYPPSLAFVVIACLEAQVMLFLGGAALVAVAVFAKMIAAWQQQEDALALGVFAAARPVLALGIFTLLFICHETGHLFALRALRMKVRSVAARMWAVGITYVPGTPLENLLVAIAGPLAAFAAALALALLLSAHPQNALGIGNLEVSYIILFGLLHIWSLRPWAGDGRQAAGAIFTMGQVRRRATGNRKEAT